MRIPTSIHLCSWLVLFSLFSVSPAFAHNDDQQKDTTVSQEASSTRPERGDKKVLFLPGATYNADDGVGVGFIASIRWPGPESEKGRPYHWDLSSIALAYFNPQPNAWGVSAKASWFPLPDGSREVQFIVHTIGWSQAWYATPGPTGAVEAWRRSEDDEVTDPWHRYGIYDLTLGSRISQRLRGGLSVQAGLRIDYDHLNIRPDTLLDQQSRAGFVIAPTHAIAATGEISLTFDTAQPTLDPTQGGVARGSLYLTAGSAGTHGKALLDLRAYTRLGPSGPVVLAGTLIGQIQWGAVPFYELSVLGDPAPKPRLSTGARSLRGLRRGQLRGPLNLLAMSELRFRLPTIRIKKLSALTQLVLSFDAVWVDTYASVGERLTPHPGLGGGIRVVLNKQLVVHVDVATAPQTTILPTDLEVWGIRGYASVDHVF